MAAILSRPQCVNGAGCQDFYMALVGPLSGLFSHLTKAGTWLDKDTNGDKKIWGFMGCNASFPFNQQQTKILNICIKLTIRSCMNYAWVPTRQIWGAANGLVILLKLESNHQFFSPWDLQFDGWPPKIIGHLFYTTSSFVHHFKSIGELKLELQFGNAQFRSKSVIIVPCDLKIWQMTLKNNRAPVLCCFKLCEPFHSHRWIQT